MIMSRRFMNSEKENCCAGRAKIGPNSSFLVRSGKLMLSRRAGRLARAHLRITVVALSVLWFYNTTAQDTLSAAISTTGQVAIIAPPSSVALSMLEDDAFVKLFRERSFHTLTSPLNVNVTEPGLVDSQIDFTPGVIPAGALVDSYLLHADPIGPSRSDIHYQGTVTFDRPILGAIALGQTLIASDADVGSPITQYGEFDFNRGFEFAGGVRDSLEVSADFRTLTFDLLTTSQLDQIRIITAAVPEPPSMALLAFTMVAIGAIGARQMR